MEEVELFPSRGFAFVTMSSISGAQAAAASAPQPELFRSIKTATPAPPLQVDFTRLPRVLPSYIYVRVRVRVRVRVCVRVCVCLMCVCVFVCVCMYIYMFTHTHTHTHTGCGGAGNISPTLYVCC